MKLFIGLSDNDLISHDEEKKTEYTKKKLDCSKAGGKTIFICICTLFLLTEKLIPFLSLLFNFADRPMTGPNSLKIDINGTFSVDTVVAPTQIPGKLL